MNYPIIVTTTNKEEVIKILDMYSALGVDASLIDMDEIKIMLEKEQNIYFFSWENTLYYTFKELPDNIDYELLIPYRKLRELLSFKNINTPIAIIGN